MKRYPPEYQPYDSSIPVKRYGSKRVKVLDTQKISVRINGEPREAPAVPSVTALLSWLSISVDRVAVELNKTIVRKRDWDKTSVPNGSEIEIVEFVGGG